MVPITINQDLNDDIHIHGLVDELNSQSFDLDEFVPDISRTINSSSSSSANKLLKLTTLTNLNKKK